MKTIEITWHELNQKGREIVAKAYGYETPEEFMKNENYDLYPNFTVDINEEGDSEEIADEQ